MVKLTLGGDGNQPLYVNPHHVISVRDEFAYDNRAIINLVDNPNGWLVRGTAEEVVKQLEAYL